jgi:uncharacterized membrane protein YbaN (DUF454 family)
VYRVPMSPQLKIMYKPIFIVLGIISVALGVLGIFLPVLPTTPFLLLATALFAKSSEKLYRRLLDNKYLGNYIKDFQEHRSIKLRIKIISISMLWISITCSALFAVKILWLQILLFAIAVAVSIHILSFKTRK